MHFNIIHCISLSEVIIYYTTPHTLLLLFSHPETNYPTFHDEYIIVPNKELFITFGSSQDLILLFNIKLESETHSEVMVKTLSA